MPVVDASVMVAILNPSEPFHRQSRAWLSETLLSGRDIEAPAIILSEVGAALARGQKDAELAREAVALLESEKLIQLRPLPLDLAARTAELAITHRLRGCDALYVALAERLDTELVSLDQQQLERGRAVVVTMQPGGI